MTLIMRTFQFGTAFFLCISAFALAQDVSAVHCTVNAIADRTFAEDHRWYGELPGYGKKADPSKPFGIVMRPNKDLWPAGFIFSKLDSKTPVIRVLTDRQDETGKPLSGYEREGTVVERTPDGLFFIWEGVSSQEYYTAVFHPKTFKATISAVSTGASYSVAVRAMTADCR